jgi:CBS domain-containing protein
MTASNPLRVHDIMTDDVVTFSPRLTLREAIVELADRGLGGAPVVENDRVVGVLSSSDILDFVASRVSLHDEASESDADDWEDDSDEDGEVFDGDDEDAPAEFYLSAQMDLADFQDELAGLGRDLLDQHRIEEIMTKRLISIAPDAEVHEAAALLLYASVHRLLVIEGDRLHGVISGSDIVRAVAQRRI